MLKEQELDDRAHGVIRTDIQVLRGIAVLFVLVYHFFPSVLPGGFLGVDVFFVISGFLITGAITKELDAGTFSLANFYFRRARRILPAALTVVVLTALSAPWFMTEEQIAELTPQVWGALTFSINFVLWNQTGYFDLAADAKPLLHYWSLAIEEQYYIVLPLALMVVVRRYWFALMSTIIVASLFAMLLASSAYPNAAFYLLPTRAWELCLGSVLSLVSTQKIKVPFAVAFSLIGLAILGTISLYPIGATHPGPDAMLVCMATVAIIYAGIPRRILCLPPTPILARIGDISFSLYLTHWPIRVYTQTAYGGDAPVEALIASMAIAFCLAILLYAFVEQPIRFGFEARRTTLTSTLVVATAAIAFVPIAAELVSRSDTDYRDLRRQNLAFPRSCAFGERYVFDGVLPEHCRTKPGAKVMVWGDSYARAWTTALLEPLAYPGVELLAMARCEALTAMSRLSKVVEEGQKWGREYSESCIDFNRKVLDYAATNQDIDIVVLGGRFQGILQPSNILLSYENGKIVDYPANEEYAILGLGRTIKALRAVGKRVVVLAPPPADGSNMGNCWERQDRGLIRFGEKRHCDLTLEDVHAYRSETYEYLAEVSNRYDVSIINMNEYFCDTEKCRIEIDGTLMFRDGGHLTVDGSIKLGRETDFAASVLKQAR